MVNAINYSTLTLMSTYLVSLSYQRNMVLKKLQSGGFSSSWFVDFLANYLHSFMDNSIPKITYTKCYLYQMLPIPNVTYAKCYLDEVLPRQSVLHKMFRCTKLPVFISALSSVLKAYKLYLLYLRVSTWSFQQEILHTTDLYFDTKVQVNKLTNESVNELIEYTGWVKCFGQLFKKFCFVLILGLWIKKIW